MRVEDVMETEVEAISGDTPADRAWEHMRHRGIALFVIVDESGIGGLVTRQQLGGRDGAMRRRGRTLADFVAGGHVTTTPDCSMDHVAKMLTGRVEGCVPVLRHGHLVGVLTLSGLLERLGRQARRDGPPRPRQGEGGRRGVVRSIACRRPSTCSA